MAEVEDEAVAPRDRPCVERVGAHEREQCARGHAPGAVLAALEGALRRAVREGEHAAQRQARDHPVVLGVPETYYLKCFILRKLE